MIFSYYFIVINKIKPTIKYVLKRIYNRDYVTGISLSLNHLYFMKNGNFIKGLLTMTCGVIS